MNPFKRKCTHPFDSLAVEKEQSIQKTDEDFDKVEYHLVCRRCSATLTLTHAKLRGGVDAFLARERKERGG